MLQVEVLETSELGDRSYVAHDGTTAVVIDPQRDVDRVEQVLSERGLTCGAVLETHIHNDYVTGGHVLAHRTGADYLVNADDPVRFDRTPVRDGDRREVGTLRVSVLSTPGHTDHHLAYLIEDGAADDPAAVFTGGSLLYGSVGRTDLVDPQRTEELTRAQFHSARRLAELPGDVRVFPTHGFGSFCSSGSSSGDESSTIAHERERNDALTTDDEDEFVETLIAGLTAYPAYYAHMGPRNLDGPGPADLSPPVELDAADLRKRIEADEWVVDLRDRSAYAGRHLVGTLGIELSTGQFSTYVGWLVPWGAGLTLIGESAEQVAAAQLQLARIGIERPDGAAVGDIADLADQPDQLGSFEIATFADLAAVDEQERNRLTVLDTRRDDERGDAAVRGSLHIPIHDLLDRLDELPDQPVWVHCATGFRSSIAASMLAGKGHEVVLVNDDFEKAVELGLT